MSSEYYELPAGDNDIFATSITATVIDSTENPVPEFSLVEFQSFTEDANGDLVPIGNIEPYKYADSNGQATATFNIGNDVGLASIVGFAPQFNLADTIYVFYIQLQLHLWKLYNHFQMRSLFKVVVELNLQN